MKKTAATIILLAGLGGGCVSPSGTNGTGMTKSFNSAYRGNDVKGVTGPSGEPITAVGGMTSAKDSGVVHAGGMMPADNGSIQQTSGFTRVGSGQSSGCSSCGDTGVRSGLMARWGHSGCNTGNCGAGAGGYGGGMGGGYPPLPGGGMMYGAVAYGAPGGMMGGMGGPMYANQRTAIKFVSPQGMQISWFSQGAYAEPGLSTPSAYNFAQGGVYRLRVRGIPNRPGKVYYPTLDVYGATPKTVTFLSHNTVPVGFTDEDFEQVNAGNMVVKVVYLPDPAYQELSTVAGAEELVSTKLQPGEDPIAEAQRRGTILAVIRLGNIDLENPNSPPMAGVPAGPGAGTPPPPMPAAAAPQTMPGSAKVAIPVAPTSPVTAPRPSSFAR